LFIAHPSRRLPATAGKVSSLVLFDVNDETPCLDCRQAHKPRGLVLWLSQRACGLRAQRQLGLAGHTATVAVNSQALWAGGAVVLGAAAVVTSLPFAFTGLGMVLAVLAMVVALPLGVAAPAPAVRRLGRAAIALAAVAIIVHVVVYVFSIV
jgi:hypothetical protein